ncbi:MAG: Holliday junction branch migration protein RuvA [Elusimicrobiota bacterium]
MIASLRGVVLERTADGAVVEVGGVGYSVSLSPFAAARLPAPGQDILLYVAESVAMYGGGTTLYGFLSSEERQIFDAFRNNVPGTGAKKALEFLDKAAKSLHDFRRAVADKDARTLVALFGFTSKTAEKIISGLQGHLGEIPLAEAPDRRPLSSAFEEAVQGLVTLGYKEPASRQATETARRALGDATAQQLIREALRQLSGRN